MKKISWILSLSTLTLVGVGVAIAAPGNPSNPTRQNDLPATLGTPVNPKRPPAILGTPVAMPTAEVPPTRTPMFQEQCPSPAGYPVNLGNGMMAFLQPLQNLWPSFLWQNPNNPNDWAYIHPDGTRECLKFESQKCFKCGEGNTACEILFSAKTCSDKPLDGDFACGIENKCAGLGLAISHGDVALIQAYLNGKCGALSGAITGSCDSHQSCNVGVTCCGEAADGALNLIFGPEGVSKCQGSANWRPGQSCVTISTSGYLDPHGGWGAACTIEKKFGGPKRK